MIEWPRELQTRLFQPREVERLTGVSAETQRLWTKRYGFDFRQLIEPAGVRPRWTWSGVQQLAAFAAIFKDMNDAQAACRIVGINNEETYRRVGDMLGSDFRDPPEGDWFLVEEFDRDPVAGPSGLTGIQNANSILKLLSFKSEAARPKGFYAFNLSAAQRRLWDALGSAIALAPQTNA